MKYSTDCPPRMPGKSTRVGRQTTVPLTNQPPPITAVSDKKMGRQPKPDRHRRG